MTENKPRYTVKAGLIGCAHWVNTAHDKNGKEFESHSVTVSNAYKDKEGNIKPKNSFKMNEIPKLISCLQQVYTTWLFKRE